jgi:hypothetical protein
MLTAIHPKLPMRNKIETKIFYIEKLGFECVNDVDFEGYLMLKKDDIELHLTSFC